jgi:hypothetical protein
VDTLTDEACEVLEAANGDDRARALVDPDGVDIILIDGADGTALT